MTASPKIASEYARGDASKVFPTHVQAQYAAREMGTEVIPVTVRGQVTGYRVPLTREGANLRPVYANLKKPFDIEAPADPSMVKNFEEWGFNYHVKPDGSPDITTNKDVYETLLRTFGYKDEVNDWLLENGFDGIIHLGGSGAKAHKVSIAFSPESVYPSFGIDALLQKPIE
jgi:hypothetical protein